MDGALKGLELVGGLRIVDRVVNAIKTVTPDVALSANHRNAGTWLRDVAILTDRWPDLGGISGVLSGLSSGRDVVVVAWDMPFVTGELLTAIVRAGIDNRADAAVPQSESPTGIEPFCAWYSASALGTLEASLAAGHGSASDIVAGLDRVHHIPQSVTAKFGDPRILFFSVNTAADLARARAIAESAR